MQIYMNVLSIRQYVVYFCHVASYTPVFKRR